MLFVVSGHGREDELVGLLVEEEDRRRLGTEDRPRDLDDRPQEPRELLLRREDARRDGRFETLLAHCLPPTFADVK